MFPTRWISRLFLLLPLTFLILIPVSRASAQGGPSREVALLRSRVQELEAQNEKILEQLSSIQALLGEAVAPEAPTENIEVASRVPIIGGSLSTVRSNVEAAPVAMIREVAQAQLPVFETEGNRIQLGVYGFVRMDAIFDDSRANAAQTPTAIRSEPAGTDSQSNFALHPRLTRIGLNFTAPDQVGGATLTGRIETDFQNGGRESRATPRFRQAFMRLGWGDHSLLAGQTQDLISPLFPSVNADTLMWNAGNLGDRRMQVRYGYDPSEGLSFRAGIGLTGAVDGQDTDGNGIRDGEASTLPHFQGRIGYNSSNVIVGVWSHYARFRTDTTYAGRNDFQGYSYGADFDFRFTPEISLRGEVWAGSNLSDVRGGIGQAFNTVTGREIDSRGGWLEVGLRKGPYAFSTGYTMDDPRNSQLGSEAPTENRAWYLTNRFNIAQPLTLGVDYMYWWTHYKDLAKGTDNRVNLYLIYGF